MITKPRFRRLFSVYTLMGPCILLLLLPITSSATLICFTATTLLSGGVTSCSGTAVNTSGCTGGLASLAQQLRWVEASTGEAALAVPYLDRETAFVQMHPYSWAVNALVFRQLGLRVGAAPPSLFVQEIPNTWAHFFNSSLEILVSNARVTAADLWFNTIRYYVTHENVALLFLDPSLDTNVVDSFDAIESILTLVELDTTIKATVVMSGSALMTPAALYSGMRSRKPNIILQQAAAGPSYYLNDTLVVLVPVSATTAQFVNVTVDSSSTPPNVSASVFSRSLAVPAFGGDERYYQDQNFLNGLAMEASVNDPVLGTSPAVMPVHRDGSFRLCFGGACPGGRLYAEGMRHYFQTDIAFTASGAFRGPGWQNGSVRISNLWSLYPFANQVCSGIVTGLTLWEMFNYSLGSSTAPSTTLTPTGDRLLQFAGMKVAFNPELTGGSRVIDILIFNKAKQIYEPVSRLQTYTYATESFTGTISSPFPTFLAARYEGEAPPRCAPTILQVAVADYYAAVTSFDPDVDPNLIDARDTGSGYSPAQQVAFMNLTQGLDTCPANTVWMASRGTCMPCPAGQQSPPNSLQCALLLVQGSDEATRLYIGILIAVVVFVLVVFFGKKFLASKQLRRLLHSGLPMMLFRALLLAGSMVLYAFAVLTVFRGGGAQNFIIVYLVLTVIAGTITLLEIIAIVRYFMLQTDEKVEMNETEQFQWELYFTWLQLLSLGLKDLPQLVLAFVAVINDSTLVVALSLCVASIFFGSKIAEVASFAAAWFKQNVLGTKKRKIESLKQLVRFVLMAFRIAHGKIKTNVPRLSLGFTAEELQAYRGMMLELFPRRCKNIRTASFRAVVELEKQSLTESEYLGLAEPALRKALAPSSRLPETEVSDFTASSISASARATRRTSSTSVSLRDHTEDSSSPRARQIPRSAGNTRAQVNEPSEHWTGISDGEANPLA